MLFAGQPLNMLVPPFQDTYDGTGWHLLASDGSGYTSLALLNAAGKTVFCQPPGSILSALLLTSVASGGFSDGPGSYFQFMYGSGGSPSTTPTIGIPVLVSGMQISVPGGVQYLWIQKATATDLINIVGWG